MVPEEVSEKTTLRGTGPFLGVAENAAMGGASYAVI
jgi:hypothetical protein